MKQQWPNMRRSGEWYDSAGTPFDPDLHHKKKGSHKPTVNKDGTFRKKSRTKAKPAPAPKGDPLKENQLLGAYKNHVDQADSIARLNELSTMGTMMGFTGEEEKQAQGWIRARRKEIESDVG